MTTYVVGDIQGCFDQLMSLLDQAGFDIRKDRLWAAGDLVNRGPKSLETLRFFASLGDRALTVLGNHDLHLLAIAHGHATTRRSDTLDAVLSAPDRHTLLEWLQQQPLLHHDKTLDLVLSHAGIAPTWGIHKSLQYAQEVQEILRSAAAPRYFASMYGNEPRGWRDDLSGPDRWRVITNYLTRMRFVDAHGNLDLANKKGPESATDGTLPWFLHPSLNAIHADDLAGGYGNTRIAFGHWASLEGKTHSPRFIALDTGCVWGGKLTALRADDGVLLECDGLASIKLA